MSGLVPRLLINSARYSHDIDRSHACLQSKLENLSILASFFLRCFFKVSSSRNYFLCSYDLHMTSVKPSDSLPASFFTSSIELPESSPSSLAILCFYISRNFWSISEVCRECLDLLNLADRIEECIVRVGDPPPSSPLPSELPLWYKSYSFYFMVGAEVSTVISTDCVRLSPGYFNDFAVSSFLSSVLSSFGFIGEHSNIDLSSLIVSNRFILSGDYFLF